MPFGDTHFDLIVSNLGINNFADPQAVMRECYRVARPGATMAVTTNARGHYAEFYAVFRDVLRAMGRSDYAERLEVEEAHRGGEKELHALLHDAGFGVSEVVKETFTMRFLDGSAMLNHRLVRIGFLDGWRGVLESKDEVTIFSAIEERLNEIAAERGGLQMSVPMLYIEGVKAQE